MFTAIVVFLVLGQFLGFEARIRHERLTPDELRMLFKNSIIAMLVVIFTYAIFIPNDARRAACVIVPMALAPFDRPPG